ncbi:MAG: branched-chain amino acid transaminase [Candidatus Micrarchaeota archaeon]|nr:branched-chain amino acid transaminase [Candidatus Micrarchaeota archaeon]
MPDQQYIWFDGKFQKFEDVKVHILTHSLQYGSGIFEGIRSYETKGNAAVFRLREHVDRFFKSAEVYMIPLQYSREQIHDAILETLKKNRLKTAYIRPFGFYNDQRIGLDVTGKKTSISIAAIPFGNYFAGKEKGVRCKISSWHKINSLILPPQAKASGNYLNSIISSIDAKVAGFDEAILLSGNGYVAEGPGENIFAVSGNTLVTPSRDADILLGITRDSVIKIAESMGIKVVERQMHREEFYTADELFFTGTAAEITHISEVDGRAINGAKMGPITKMLSSRFSGVITGKDKEFSEWLTNIY